MQKNVINYIEENFPYLGNEINLRFELGEPYDNGTDARINQVVKRVTTLFEDTFSIDDMIHVYIEDWEIGTDVMFGNTTPDYLYELIKQHKFDEITMYKHDEEEDNEGNTIQIERPYKVRTFSSKLSSIPYKDILIGIANYEQGREPSIYQQVYFINMNKDIIFYMYDDRGCIIFSKTKEKLHYLYEKYNDWLVDYWREYFDNIFK